MHLSFIFIFSDLDTMQQGTSLSLSAHSTDTFSHRLLARGTPSHDLQQLLPSGPILSGGHTEQDDSGGVVTFSNNSGVALSCDATGDPAPSITWRYLDQNPVSSISGIREVGYCFLIYLFIHYGILSSVHI